MPFYAVAIGKNPGIYNTWPQCESQVKGFKNARFKKFNTQKEAKEFCEKNGKGGPSSGMNSVKLDDSNKRSLSSNKRKCSDGDTTSPSTSFKKASLSGFRWTTYGSKSDYTDTVIVYTDGACTANGKKSAKGGIGVYWGDNHEDNVSEPLIGKQTNNRAEIQAVVKAVNQAKNRGHKSVTVRTDSQFLLNSITTWIHKWIKNDWKLSTGEPVKNKDDFKDLLEAMKGIEVHWEKVPAHRGIKGNEMADKLAVEGAKKNRV